MKRRTRHIETELAVVGAGMAGFAASIFALERGIEVAQFGPTGAIAYTTGYFDLLGVHQNKILEDPWAGLDVLRAEQPLHPLSRLGNEDICMAIELFADTVSQMGIQYSKPQRKNQFALLPYGVTKPTLCLPKTMLPGIAASQSAAKTLVVGFKGLQGFSATEFVINVSSFWPNLVSATLHFPDMQDQQLYPEVMARALETEDAREKLAQRIRPHIEGAQYVGLPAILGMHDPDAVLKDMERRIGATLFEIPTIPPAVQGIRLREMFERELPSRGLTLEPGLKVHKAEFRGKRATLHLRGPMEDIEVVAQAVVLATGRFLSGGLNSDHRTLRETLFGLPVTQPEGRQNWHRQEYLDPRGHPINRAGIEVDDSFRPLGDEEEPFNQRLFAIGSLLAHQDWVRQRCGAGLAIATAYGAVRAVSELLS